jgi:hypothetical protein
MNIIKGKCTNFLNCEHADNESILEKLPDEDFFCECGHELRKIPIINNTTRYVIILSAIGALAIFLVIFLLMWVPSISVEGAPITKVKQDDKYDYRINIKNSKGQVNYIIEQKPSFIQFDHVIGKLTGEPRNSDIGNHPVKILIFDDEDSLDYHFIIEVLDVNDIVKVSWDFPTAYVDSTYEHIIEIINIDIVYSITVHLTSKPDWLQFDASDFRISGIPSITDTGINNIEIIIEDGEFVIDTTIAIQVNNLNLPPSFVSTPTTSVNEDEPYIYSIIVEDPNPTDILKVIIGNGPKWLVINQNLELIGTPTNEDVGVSKITLLLSDENVREPIIQEFLIQITNINDAPMFTSIPITEIEEDQKYSYHLTFKDIDKNDAINIIISEIPGWLTFYDNILSGIPTDLDVGTHSVVIIIDDGLVLTPPKQEFTINVININDIPEITSIADTLATEGKYYRYQLEVVDRDSDEELKIEVPIHPNWLSFRAEDRILSGTPRIGFDEGIFEVLINVSDGEWDISQNFMILVTKDSTQVIYSTEFVTFDSVNANTSYMNTIKLREFEEIIKEYNQIEKLWIKINPEQRFTTYYIGDPLGLVNLSSSQIEFEEGCIILTKETPIDEIELNYFEQCTIDKMQSTFIYYIINGNNEK